MRRVLQGQGEEVQRLLQIAIAGLLSASPPPLSFDSGGGFFVEALVAGRNPFRDLCKSRGILSSLQD
jgi:hypothetical protein